ncbi:hypothetical protein BHF69_11590 [Anaerostipes sp. 992a]|nr:hypothetical protein BHF69_11590 [Anaerostipes sp. 992a]
MTKIYLKVCIIRRREQFYQGQCAVVRGTETEVCQIHKFPGNLKKYLPKKADCIKAMAFHKCLVNKLEIEVRI